MNIHPINAVIKYKKNIKVDGLDLSRPIKVIYIIDKISGNLGGTENQLIKLINGLNKNRCQIKLICLDNTKWFQSNVSTFQCPSTVIHINKFKKPSAYLNLLSLIRILRRDKPDIVHTFFPVGNILGVIAAKLAGVKNIISSRRDYGEWMDARYLMATRIANRLVTKIIANSLQVKELTVKREKTRDGQVEAILNGIALAPFQNIEHDSGLKKRLGIPDNDKVVGIVANFRPMKHHHIFVQAANEMLKAGQNVSFILVGSGYDSTSTLEKTKSLCKTFNISDKFYFVGAQQDVIPYLSIMDVGVNCSEREGLSNAVMEYMAAGVPCVVSDAGGNPDLITHEVNGYVFKLDDHKVLADLTLRLFDDEATMQRFVKISREKIEKEMSVEAMLSQYEGLYGSLVEIN